MPVRLGPHAAPAGRAAPRDPRATLRVSAVSRWQYLAVAEGRRIRRLAAREAFLGRLRQGDTYGLLLFAIVVTYGFMAVLEDGGWRRAILGMLFAAVLLLSLYTSHVRGRVFAVTAVIVTVATVANAIQAAMGDVVESGGTVMLVLVVAAPFVVLRRILRHPSVDVETILGVVCAYLLIGIAFAGVYGEMDRLGDEHFFAQGRVEDPVEYLYFSYVVLTTVGFGDLTPGTNPGRVLVTIEALFGQVFLVTIVAGLVGSFARSRASPREDGG
jgi:hypothetical protein